MGGDESPNQRGFGQIEQIPFVARLFASGRPGAWPSDNEWRVENQVMLGY
jgi:hypothetical protein